MNTDPRQDRSPAAERLRSETPEEPDSLVREGGRRANQEDPEDRALADTEVLLAEGLSALRIVRPGFQAQLQARLLAQLPEARRPWLQRLFANGPRRTMLSLPRGAAGLVAVLIALAILTGAAYAVAPLLNRVFESNPGTRQILQANLAREVNLSQTVDGFTVTLQRVYADANQIVVGYTVSGPMDRTFNNFHFFRPTLSDAEGKRLPEWSGWGGGMYEGIGPSLIVFDAAAITGNPAELQLRLETGIQAVERLGPEPTRPPFGPEPTPVVMSTAPRAPHTDWIRFVTIPGPFEFRFTVPLISGRVGDVHQTVTASGIPLTLEKVVVTPVETRAYLHWVRPKDTTFERWMPIGQGLSVGDWDSRKETGGSGGHGGWKPDSYIYSFFGPLYDKQGEWTLTMDEFTGHAPDPGPDGSVQQTRLTGPWVFRFTVP